MWRIKTCQEHPFLIYKNRAYLLEAITYMGIKSGLSICILVGEKWLPFSSHVFVLAFLNILIVVILFLAQSAEGQYNQRFPLY